ncbi:MAG: sensor histidine kinase [Kiloniellaceae bacterium]
MPGGATVVLPLWAVLAGAGLCLLIAALTAVHFLHALRQSGRFAALAAQLTRAGDSLERDAHSTHEATQALQIQLEEALTRLRKARDKAHRADRANQAKSAFLAMMSHELRTPLSAIIGFSEMIEQQAMGPIGNQKYREYAVDIRESGQHLLGIINDILDLSKVEAGKESLHEQDIPFEALIDGVRVLLEGRARDAGVALSFDCTEDLPGIRADKRRLTQILVNLLTNGIKFTPEGGSVTLRCWATEDSGFVFQAIDTGIGIARDDIALALSVFGQVDNGTKHQAKGTGLGLPLSKALAELHGGTLDLQSEPAKGTTVTLRLPAYRILARSAEIPAQQVAAG